MTTYKEYKAEEDERRIAKQIRCPHVSRIQLTMRCKECGRINTLVVNRDEICPSIIDCLCICKRTLAS